MVHYPWIHRCSRSLPDCLSRLLDRLLDPPPPADPSPWAHSMIPVPGSSPDPSPQILARSQPLDPPLLATPGSPPAPSPQILPRSQLLDPPLLPVPGSSPTRGPWTSPQDAATRHHPQSRARGAALGRPPFKHSRPSLPPRAPRTAPLARPPDRGAVQLKIEGSGR